MVLFKEICIGDEPYAIAAIILNENYTVASNHFMGRLESVNDSQKILPIEQVSVIPMLNDLPTYKTVGDLGTAILNWIRVNYATNNRKVTWISDTGIQLGKKGIFDKFGISYQNFADQVVPSHLNFVEEYLKEIKFSVPKIALDYPMTHPLRECYCLAAVYLGDMPF